MAEKATLSEKQKQKQKPNHCLKTVSTSSWIRKASAFSENLNSNPQCWFRPVASTFNQQEGAKHRQCWTRVQKVHACGRSLVWFRTSACHVDDPGSNPGDRTIFPLSLVRIILAKNNE